MKLAEALMLRSDYQVKIEKLRNRILNNVKIQEGEEVAEDPNKLLAELNETIVKLTDLIQRINHTNSTALLVAGKTISAALAERDTLASKRSILDQVVGAASIKQSRVSRSEIKFISTVNVSSLQKEIDQLSKTYRELDTKIQEKNWSVDLL